ncbi:MAG: hypothetical protein JNL12_21975 [Planctomycetes bacterium]|nr:hypothetical protein [Planctomycetota bacterium]
MNRSEFEVRLHACLDARRDPFDDEELVAWLDTHPEELAGFARLVAGLHGLRSDQIAATPSAGSTNASAGASAGGTRVAPAAVSQPPRGSLRRWRWLVLGAGLAGVAAACLVVACWPDSADVPPSERTIARSRPVAVPAAGRILSATVEPLAPTLGLATRVRATEVLVARPDTRIEVFTQWSVR